MGKAQQRKSRRKFVGRMHPQRVGRHGRLIKHLLAVGLVDYEDGKLIQHAIVPYARRHEGIHWERHPELPGCVIIDKPFDPGFWEGYPIGVL